MIWIVTPYAHFGGGFGGLRGLFPSARDLAIHNKFGFYPNAVDTSERAASGSSNIAALGPMGEAIFGRSRHVVPEPVSGLSIGSLGGCV